jgi:hypothetical protein
VSSPPSRIAAVPRHEIAPPMDRARRRVLPPQRVFDRDAISRGRLIPFRGESNHSMARCGVRDRCSGATLRA